MGKKIVQEQYPEEPSEWSRLWTSSDIYSAFINEKEMKNVETISLAFSISNEESDQVKKVFAKMKKLRLLKVHYSDTYEGHGYKMPNPRGFGFPPNLRYLHWEGLESWPSNFHGENLVAINLKSSNIKELLTGKKYLAELKFIDLSNSKRLIKLPELSRMPKLEKLNLKGCTSFCKLHSSIGTFSEMIFLKELNFSGSGIRELPSNIGSLISLETLNLSKCLKFEKFPDRIFENMECLKVLVLYESGIKELPNSIGHLQSLQSLNLSGCSNFKKFPEIKRNMKSLKRLVLDNTAIRELPTSIGCLKALEFLSLCGCLNFEKFPEIQNNMESLREIFLGNSGIKELSCWITCLPGLAHLDLENCKNLRSFPSNICRLKSLQHLSLEGCSNLEVFPEMMEDMEHLRCLYLRDLIISGLPSISIEHLKGLRCLELNNCENLETLPNSIGNLTCLGALVVHNSPKLQKLPDTLKNLQCCLKVLDLSGCHLMEGAIPSDIWCLFSLISLSLSENNILRIPVGIIHLSQLRELRMNHCPMLEEIPELPTSLRSIEAHGCPCLETLSTLPKHLLWSYLLNCFKSQIQDLGKETFVRCEINGPIVLHETNVVIPGNRGLPKWIHHKTKGNEIRIELPKNCYEDDNFLGFALFFHLVPLGEENDSDDTCNVIDERQSENIPQVVKLQISHGDQFENVDDLWAIQICKFHSISGLGYRTFDEYKKGSTSSPNPALLVVYYPRISISSRYRSSGCNNFKARFTGLFICGEVPFKVKSCGIHLIYDGDALDHHGKQGIQLFDVKTGHDTTSHQIKTSLPSNSFHRVLILVNNLF